ncbi:MAG TPA: TolC family protein [Candidatus Saccharimonadales bacterium]|nr:TolC family protein [Candidatus Saccharimonadales bacterium]
MMNTSSRKIRTPLIPILLVAVMQVAMLPLHAEQVEFRQAIDLALKHSGAMIAASADRARAAERYHAERDSYYPTVVFGSGLGYSVGIPVSIAGQAPSLFNLTHTQTLFNLAERETVRALHSDSVAANIDYVDRSEQVILDTSLLYIELDNTVQRLNFAKQQKDAVSHALFVAQQRQQEGLGSLLDTKRAQLDTARVDLRIAELEGAVDMLRERLGRTVGRSPGTLETVSTSIPAAPELRTETDVTAVAIANSNTVRSAEEHVRGAKNRARAEHKMKYPSLDFAGQYSEYATFNNYDQYYKHFSRHNYSFGINLRVPLFNLSQNARAAAADAEALRAEADAQAVRDQVATDAVRAQHALRQLGAASTVSRLEYEVAQANIDAVQLQVQNGKASAQDQELARADIANRQVLLLQNQFEYLQAELKLLRQIGELRTWALGR